MSGHHPLGPSTLARREACPGSYHAEVPLWHAPQEVDEDTRRGSARHAAAHRGLLRRADRPLAVADLPDAEDRALVESWWTWWDAQMDTQGLAVWAAAEEAVAMPDGSWGSYDAAVLFAAGDGTHTLVLADLKGQPQGHPRNNLQLHAYLQGVLIELEIEDKPPPDRVVLAIVSRAGVDSEQVSLEQYLHQFTRIERVKHSALNPDAPRRPGPHCQYCRAATTCAERRAVAKDVATWPALLADPAAVLATLTPQQRTEAADSLRHARDLLDQAVTKFNAAIREGTLEVPGYRAVQGTRQEWADPAYARVALLAIATERGLREEDLFTMPSPAAAAKLLGKDAIEHLTARAPSTPSVRRVKLDD